MKNEQEMIKDVELKRAIFEQYSDNGKASKLFLGYQEWHSLRMFILQNQAIHYINNSMIFMEGTHDKRPMWRGLKVYRVDGEEYCEVGK